MKNKILLPIATAIIAGAIFFFVGKSYTDTYYEKRDVTEAIKEVKWKEAQNLKKYVTANFSVTEKTVKDRYGYKEVRYYASYTFKNECKVSDVNRIMYRIKIYDQHGKTLREGKAEYNLTLKPGEEYKLEADSNTYINPEPIKETVKIIIDEVY